MLDIFKQSLKRNLSGLEIKRKEMGEIYKEKLGLVVRKQSAKNLESKEKISEKKHFSPANQVWLNSIYSYNKNSVKSLPLADKITKNILKSYFTFKSKDLNEKSNATEMRLKRLSLNKILLGKSEIKHTNDKVIMIKLSAPELDKLTNLN